MERVFISNNTEVATKGFEITKDFDAINLPVKSEHQDGNTVFVIDVHCTCKGAEKLQQQGGVTIYRHLLKQFEKCQDKLKVIFYSPISNVDLVKLKPENYVLSFLPFIELFPDTKQYGIKPEEWTFSKALAEAEKVNCPQFNNASENLLSGWALANKNNIKNGYEPEKINTNGKKILFIDDQQSEWGVVFSNIFPSHSIKYIKDGRGYQIENQKAYREKLKNQWNGFISYIKDEVALRPDLILSDLYLKENHEISKWQNLSKIRKISGFQLFSEIRVIAPSIPYIFHTSSNKASIYKALDANGVDDLVIKDVRTASSNEEKKENYDGIKDCIEGYFSTDYFDRMDKIWQEIIAIENISTQPWWVNTSKNISKVEIINYLKNCWMMQRRFLNREVYFEKEIGLIDDNESSWFTTASILNNLGKVLEFVAPANRNVTDWDKCSSIFELSYQIRNCSSHYQDNSMLSVKDVFLLFDLVFYLLKNKDAVSSNSESTIGLYQKIKTKAGGILQRKYALFWCYLVSFNNSAKLDPFKKNIGDRMLEYFSKCDKVALLSNLNSELKTFINNKNRQSPELMLVNDKYEIQC